MCKAAYLVADVAAEQERRRLEVQGGQEGGKRRDAWMDQVTWANTKKKIQQLKWAHNAYKPHDVNWFVQKGHFFLLYVQLQELIGSHLQSIEVAKQMQISFSERVGHPVGNFAPARGRATHGSFGRGRGRPLPRDGSSEPERGHQKDGSSGKVG